MESFFRLLQTLWTAIIGNFEIIAAILGFFYVLLEVLQKSWMWYLWFFTSIAYFFVYARNSVYAMMLLQVYNAVVCVYGLLQWRKSKEKIAGSRKSGYKVGDDDKEDTILVIRKLQPKLAAISLLTACVVFFSLALFLDNFTNDASPWLDSGVTTLCMLATFLLSRQNIENWYVWIVCNSISVYFYYSLKMYPTAILYFIYIIMAVWGAFHWKKKGFRLD